MAPVGAVADRLFEGEILAAALEQQGADRRIQVGPVEDDAFPISMLLFQVMASAGSQPAAAKAWITSFLEPTRPTLIGSPGMPCGVVVIMPMSADGRRPHHSHSRGSTR